MEVRKITKTATFKNFLHLIYKNTITFFVTVFFNIFLLNDQKVKTKI